MDRMVIQFVAFVLSLSLVGASREAEATNYFNWGVESNVTSQGFTVKYFGTSSRDCTVAHSGSCSMKTVVHGVDGGNQTQGADNIDWNRLSFNVVGGPAIYYRAWLMFMPGFSWGTPQVANVKTSRAIGGAYPRLMTGHMRSDGFHVAECETVGGVSGGGCLTTSGVPNNDYQIHIPYDVAGKADGLWHEYILMIKPNTSASVRDAVFSAWVDGVQVGTLTGWRLSDSPNPNLWNEAWGGWMVTQYFQMNGTSSDGGTLYADDFSTDDVYNSLTGLPAPTGLRVAP